MNNRTTVVLTLLASLPFQFVAGQDASTSPASGRPQASARVIQPPVAVPRDSAGELRPHIIYQIQAARTAVRPGEHHGAPWADVLGGPGGTGRIVRSVHLPGIAMQPEERTVYQLSERLYVIPPTTRPPILGQRYLTAALGETVTGARQVMIPTGIVSVDHVGGSGEASIARITHQFGPVRATDVLVPFDVLTMSAGPASAVMGGLTTHVSWVEMASVLPSLQRYLVVDAGERAGVRPGDIFTLVRPRVEVEEGLWLPEREIARAQVVKVTPYGSTVIIIDQKESAIGVGVAARLTARIQ